MRVGLRSWQLERVPAWAIDAVLAAGTAVVISAWIGLASERDARPPDLGAYALGLTIAALLLVRRRWPLGVLLASAAVFETYLALDYPAIAPPLALGVALYTVAAGGHLRWGLLVIVLLEVMGLFYRVLVEREQLLLVVGSTLGEAGLAGAALFLGDAVRSRRALMAEVGERLRRAELEREREAQRRVDEERLRIARELHDVVAHTVAVIAVQAGVASDVFDQDPAETRAALGRIRAASREAMAELKATVGVLRGGEGGDAPRAPAPGLNQLDTLITTASRAGLRVQLAVSGEGRPLPTAVDLASYRIIQESLTNVLRHARATTATVAIGYQPDGLTIEVADDGRGSQVPVASGQGGHGLAGMQERTAAVGGRLEAGPQPGGGFRVRAWLPTQRVPL